VRAAGDERRMTRPWIALASCTAALAAVFAAACSSTSSSKGAADGGDDGDSCTPVDSACGQPCDQGNSLGIGRFCNGITDCVGTHVPTLCATLGDPSEHFCTARCNPPDAGPEAGAFLESCGENAICACQGGQCGCFPTACNH
jgi:hypothetical protein